MRYTLLTIIAFFSAIAFGADRKINDSGEGRSHKPRVIISSDIGGTDPDDNQSVAHLLMYSNEIDLEGLISSPSFGDGHKGEFLRMIDIYGRDLLKLSKHISGLMTPEQLRPLVKQGRQSEASACVTLDNRNQKWKGYYKDNGLYVLRHSTYYTGTLDYTITSTVKGFKPITGQITVENMWKRNGSKVQVSSSKVQVSGAKCKSTDFRVGYNWWTDSYAPEDYWHKYAGANYQVMVREEVMRDWAKRWSWLK